METKKCKLCEKDFRTNNGMLICGRGKCFERLSFVEQDVETYKNYFLEKEKAKRQGVKTFSFSLPYNDIWWFESDGKYK